MATAKKKKEDHKNAKGIGHNKLNADQIVELAQRQANIDAQRKKLNKESAEIREVVKDAGEDTDAFKDTYAYFKKRRQDRIGYDESQKKMWEALNGADTREMFSFQQDKD